LRTISCFSLSSRRAASYAGGGDVGVAEPFLNLGDVGLMIERVGGGRRAQRMGADRKAELRRIASSPSAAPASAGPFCEACTCWKRRVAMKSRNGVCQMPPCPSITSFSGAHHPERVGLSAAGRVEDEGLVPRRAGQRVSAKAGHEAEGVGDALLL
jgi:hypothetical protein